jgi:hypothetical protein
LTLCLRAAFFPPPLPKTGEERKDDYERRSGTIPPEIRKLEYS